jgi:hypothetical protein
MDENVGHLDIPVNHLIVVEIEQPFKDISDVWLGPCLCEAALFPQFGL